MADDVPVGSNDQGLRDRVAAIHQGARGLAIGPADTEAELEIAHELIHTVGRRERIFSRQADEFHAASHVLFAHLLVFRHLVSAWTAPRSPKIYDDDFAGEVSETETALVERLELVRANVFRQSA